MKTLLPSILLALLVASGCVSNQKENTASSEKPNFLIFFIDDLRPELGCYGETHIQSPNIDQIAQEGLKFNRAYCNVPVCGASRASLLTGVRPGPQRFVGYNTRADEDLPGHISMPAYFKDNGYYTTSYGKIFHHADDSENSWSEKPWHPKPTYSGNWRDYIDPKTAAGIKAGTLQGPTTEIAIDAPDTIYQDGRTAAAAIRKLQLFAENDQPFMFWVGFLKPHLPFNAPSKYWDMYDRTEIEIATNPDKPLNAPKQSLHNFGEMRAYDDIPKTGPVSDEKARELIHGYSACVSYTDALIGQVMDELKRLNLEKNTIVAVFGDHGWNLGEHGLWCKHCNYNTSLHVPLIIKVPGKAKGQVTEGLTEFVDLYPTFAELAGLPEPDWTDGKSIVPLLDDPELVWNEPVYPRYVLGNSIVTEDFIYSEYMRSRKDCTIVANMLYDHRIDPDENINVSQEEDYQGLVDSLSINMNKVHFR
ncbi:MAG: sulfatase [Bacteroidales bacterium]|jgi:iduronate 2-sulfatase|nr:sulfatase [Bacteroidales bacterium]